MNCRHCHCTECSAFLDLGHAPPSNAYLSTEDLSAPEITYPLRVVVCTNCHLVQTEDYAEASSLFRPDYAYFSSTSTSWLEHAAQYAAMIIERLGLGPQSNVIEIASNDGYLLRHFVSAGIPCLGIEPTESTAAAAEAFGIPVLREFFGETLGKRLAGEGRKADLVCGNNVLAHVPDINDFARGLAAVLNREGVITLEFPHVMRLLEHCQFDTVYHEHFSYLSLSVVVRVLEKAGLRVFDVEELSTHGGSLRVYGCHADAGHPETSTVATCLAEEIRHGLARPATYEAFQARADKVKDELLLFLVDSKREGRSVAGYGAAAKGNTLLNYAGVKPDLLPFICDAAPSKQGCYMPGSHIPILPPSVLEECPPDYLLILPWNIADEVKRQNCRLAAHGSKFVTAIPTLEIE